MNTSSRAIPTSPSSCVSSLPARPTNGDPVAVLVAAGRLADEQQVRVGVAGAEDDLRPGLREVRAQRRRRGPHGRRPRASRGVLQRCPGRPSGAMLSALRRLPSRLIPFRMTGPSPFGPDPGSDRTSQAHLRPRPVSQWGTGPTPLHASPSSAQAVSARRSLLRSGRRPDRLRPARPRLGRRRCGRGAALRPRRADPGRRRRASGRARSSATARARRVSARSPAHEAFGLHPLMTVTADGAVFAGAGCAIAGTSDRSLALARAARARRSG